MNAIATAELRMLIRNRLVAACAILIPLALGVVFLFNVTGTDGIVFVAVMQLLIMTAMGVYVTATTTLAARRQTLFLKRLRSGVVSDRAILAGLVGPIVLVSVIQLAIIMVALSVAAGAVPANAWLLVVLVLAVEAMFVGFALATAGVTTSPEHAQVTTLPIFFLTLGVPFWVILTGTEDLGLLKQVLPGGTIPELMELSWLGGDLSTVPLLVVPLLAWAAVAVVAARIMFRWEPRS